jgi:hypothetical protein
MSRMLLVCRGGEKLTLLIKILLSPNSFTTS